jgi:ankyrin repeat protein
MLDYKMIQSTILATDSMGWTALDIAKQNSNEEVVQLLGNRQAEAIKPGETVKEAVSPSPVYLQSYAVLASFFCNSRLLYC